MLYDCDVALNADWTWRCKPSDAVASFHRCPVRDVRDSGAARDRRHGRSVPRAGHPLEARRRCQGAAGVGRRHRPVVRFQREAELLAALNHPNIAAIYGVEEIEGTRALILELVEGPTLADRLARDRFRSTKRLRSPVRSSTLSTRLTKKASSIAISSRPTSRCVRTERSRCSTSAWPKRSNPTRTHLEASSSPTMTGPVRTASA